MANTRPMGLPTHLQDQGGIRGGPKELRSLKVEVGEGESLLTLLGCVFTVGDPGQTKVSDFAAQGLRYQDVGCPQVTVDGIHMLYVSHPFCDLREQVTW